MNRILYLIFSLFALLTVYTVINTYGLLESKNKIEMNQTLAYWNVVINGTDIKSGEKFVVDKINVEDNNNVLNGKLAPGVKGYFDIEIDCTEASVSIIYTINFDFSKISDSFVIEKVEETTSGNLTKIDDNTYSKVLKLKDKKNNIRVYLKWENKEENNEIDSQVGLTKDNYINIPITISALQYTGE